MPTKMPLGSPSGQYLTCKVPNCHTKPFASNYNLQRHIKNVHNPDAVITMPCGTPIGPRSKDMSNVTRHIKTCGTCQQHELHAESPHGEASEVDVPPTEDTTVNSALPQETTR
ncbi:hypothetical protein LZ32DRAFT_603196 [Colletotrichum eremochloae]|nr:hypothetical protein LZ32DRAFT_603196 [Colletotrichum eremochloae]